MAISYLLQRDVMFVTSIHVWCSKNIQTHTLLLCIYSYYRMNVFVLKVLLLLLCKMFCDFSNHVWYRKEILKISPQFTTNSYAYTYIGIYSYINHLKNIPPIKFIKIGELYHVLFCAMFLY